MLGPPTGSTMMSTPRPPVISPTRLLDGLALAVDDMIGAEFAGEAHLGFAADDTDDDEAGRFRQIDQRIPHAAGGGVDEHALALARPHCVVEQVIGNLIVGKRRRRIEIDVVGQNKCRVGGRRNVFRVVAAAMGPFAGTGVDALAWPPRRDARANLFDRA